MKGNEPMSEKRSSRESWSKAKQVVGKLKEFTLESLWIFDECNDVDV